MAEVAGDDSGVEWGLTFGYILLPGAVIGALLGWAEFLRRTGGRPGRHRLAYAPLLFAAVLVPATRSTLGPSSRTGSVVARSACPSSPCSAASRSPVGDPAGGGSWPDSPSARLPGVAVHRGRSRRRQLRAGHAARSLGERALREPAAHASRWPRRCRTARPNADAPGKFPRRSNQGSRRFRRPISKEARHDQVKSRESVGLLLLLAVLVVSAVGSGEPASAATPEHVKQSVVAPAVDLPAGAVCDFGYHQESSYTQSLTQFFDATGNLVRVEDQSSTSLSCTATPTRGTPSSRRITTRRTSTSPAASPRPPARAGRCATRAVDWSCPAPACSPPTS